VKYTKFILVLLIVNILFPLISFTSDNHEIFDIEIGPYGNPDTRYSIRGLEKDKDNNIYFATIHGIDDKQGGQDIYQKSSRYNFPSLL